MANLSEDNEAERGSRSSELESARSKIARDLERPFLGECNQLSADAQHFLALQENQQSWPWKCTTNYVLYWPHQKGIFWTDHYLGPFGFQKMSDGSVQRQVDPIMKFHGYVENPHHEMQREGMREDGFSCIKKRLETLSTTASPSLQSRIFIFVTTSQDLAASALAAGFIPFVVKTRDKMIMRGVVAGRQRRDAWTIRSFKDSRPMPSKFKPGTFWLYWVSQIASWRPGAAELFDDRWKI